ncbi:hypothetical protein [Actinocrispum sp. NPDC049592]|uniref:hypothetical protein n=1 Tax=Actinocrispum sp. NPDC049592 TaxID=3154835 RepID=UPI00344A7507
MTEPLFPSMPPVKQAPKVKPPVPKEINLAFGIWVLSTILASVLQLMDLNAFVDAYLKQVAGTPQADVMSAGTIKGVYIVMVIGVGLLMLLFAWKMRSGRNWARIVLAILAVVSLMMQAAAVGIGSVLSVVGVLITASALVFMFVPASNAYFALFRRPRP